MVIPRSLVGYETKYHASILGVDRSEGFRAHYHAEKARYERGRRRPGEGSVLIDHVSLHGVDLNMWRRMGGCQVVVGVGSDSL